MSHHITYSHIKRYILESKVATERVLRRGHDRRLAEHLVQHHHRLLPRHLQHPRRGHHLAQLRPPHQLLQCHPPLPHPQGRVQAAEHWWISVKVNVNRKILAESRSNNICSMSQSVHLWVLGNCSVNKKWSREEYMLMMSPMQWLTIGWKLNNLFAFRS